MFLIDRRYVRHFDWLGFLLIMVISIIGLLFVYSATYKVEQPYSLFFKKQAFGLATGWLIYAFFCSVDYRTLMRVGYFIYLAVIGLLVFTILKGSIGMGGQRWINIGLFKFQPSELSKLFFPAFITYYLITEDDTLELSFKRFIPVLATLAISFVLIMKQPDLGTALILAFSAITLLWLTGITRKFFIIGFMTIILCAPVLWHFLKPYQKQRIAVFLGEGDVKKERYQLEQAKIAIGSGGLSGKGFLQGTQNKCLFLPESRTDFIFAVACEEVGFVGAISILLLYLILFFRFFAIILSLKIPFIQLLATGIVIHIMISTLINVGMVLGLLPVVGIPLPLMSYGISNLWITFASLGWFNGIAMRRFYMGQSSYAVSNG
ncbi:MAG: FtsW/RodA/SpoVE family cell cycle protein [Candidatus Dependentiae bacterium]|nr:FtsW/RodA/SpoVE family cell cycle protein [Candidatus Dependentiae bacterium]